MPTQKEIISRVPLPPPPKKTTNNKKCGEGFFLYFNFVHKHSGMDMSIYTQVCLNAKKCKLLIV